MPGLLTGGRETIVLAGGRLRYWPDFLSGQEAELLFSTLQARVAWQQSQIRIAGKVIPIPRLNAWYGDPGADYSYSGVRLVTLPWLPELLAVKKRVEQAADQRFNSALLNLYRDGRDSVDWHADDEPELGVNPVIASVSLGAERRFELRPRQAGQSAGFRRKSMALELPSGSLLVMETDTQHNWQHRLPKARCEGDYTRVGTRINITFRRVGITAP